VRRWEYAIVTILLSLAGCLSAPAPAKASTLDDAVALQQKGKLKEARELFRSVAADFRSAGDRQNLATALSEAGKISISLGEYADAIKYTSESVELRKTFKDSTGLGADFNALGRANQYLGNYPLALENYENALKIDRSAGDVGGEITRLNNIGNIYFFQGRYSTALESYQEAFTKVKASSEESWNPYERQLTIANTAILYQRVGLEERALELYKQLSSTPQAMPANEYAQLLSNEGILYRRLGDPIKALELYRAAQALFRTDRHADGEIGALRNIGIARAVDLEDLHGALEAFTAALKLSKQSSNSRGAVQASLYLGEVLRRLNRMKEAEANLAAARDGAQKAGLIEDQWKALYALGRVAEDTGRSEESQDDYRKAISIIETVRAGLQTTSLRSDFLADKRDVYDALIALQIQKPVPAVPEILQWMERSRARTLTDRMAAQSHQQQLSLEEIQSQLDPRTVFVEFWIGGETGAAVWATSTVTGLVRYSSKEQIQEGAALLLEATQNPKGRWKELSRDLGNQILAGIPLNSHMILVPDGPLNIPFEILGIPGSDALLVEKSDVTYLPAARFLGSASKSDQRWLFPWSRQLVAFGDPPLSSSDSLAEKEKWQRLPASVEEVREISRILPGSAEIHLGSDARKTYLLDRHIEGVPLLHFGTHAFVDIENPDRSRILLASNSSSAEYLFQQEVYDLDLRNVGLVTLSACDTARGKVVRGEGMQAFSQAFFVAGASATVTSLWKVDDGPTASFMRQFYYFLGRNRSKAEALQAAKLQFLRSNSPRSSPRYWAAFVLNGDGWNPTTRVVPWNALLFAVAAVLMMVSFVLWRFWWVKAEKKEGRTAEPSPLRRPRGIQTPVSVDQKKP